ncbi:MAG: sugar ABC transporter permease, partial [Caldimonas sp.]
MRLLDRVTPWLLLMPALVLLVTFTHWPALATVWDSFWSTPKK